MTTRILRRTITVLSAAAVVGLLPACSSVPGSTRALRFESPGSAGATEPGGTADGPVISMTSEALSLTVSAQDDDKIVSSLRTIGASATVDRVRGVGRLHFKGRDLNARGVPRLVVIDGVPLDEDFGVSIAAPSVARVDVMTDSIATSPYGPRGRAGVVLVTLRPH